MSDSMPLHIGIVGCSAPGAALCFTSICAEGERYLGSAAHPEISMHVLNFAELIAFFAAGDWDGIGEMLVTSTRHLRASGADFAICPDNTVHIAYEGILAKLTLPWIHIADPVAEEATRRGYRRIAILGTRPLVQSDVHAKRLSARGIVPVLPYARDIEALHNLILDELVRGIVSENGRRLLFEVVQRMQTNEGCDAVLLGPVPESRSRKRARARARARKGEQREGQR
jgi:aspartate racemase